MNSAKFPYTETESDTIRRKDGGVAPPINIFGLFQHPDYDSDLDSSTAQPEGGEGLLVGDDGENQELKIGGRTLVIRQHAYHQANANQVWPGTFVLADFIGNRERYTGVTTGTAVTGTNTDSAPPDSAVRILELGSATGALAVCLQTQFPNLQVITCDIDDEGEVQRNVHYNFEQNGLEAPPHVAYSWGQDWPTSLAAALNHASWPRTAPWSALTPVAMTSAVGASTALGGDKDATKRNAVSGADIRLGISFIIASDILLYVSAYPALVDSLVQIFAAESGTLREFLMAWNRRIAASSTFFRLMREAGFRCHHHGQGKGKGSGSGRRSTPVSGQGQGQGGGQHSEGDESRKSSKVSGGEGAADEGAEGSGCGGVFSFFTSASAQEDPYLETLSDNYWP